MALIGHISPGATTNTVVVQSRFRGRPVRVEGVWVAEVGGNSATFNLAVVTDRKNDGTAPTPQTEDYLVLNGALTANEYGWVLEPRQPIWLQPGESLVFQSSTGDVNCLVFGTPPTSDHSSYGPH